MTQKERILEYLLNNKSITPMEAWNKLGVYRLGARIHDLRNDGIEIKSSLTEVKNKFGERCNVAEYSLKAEP